MRGARGGRTPEPPFPSLWPRPFNPHGPAFVQSCTAIDDRPPAHNHSPHPESRFPHHGIRGRSLPCSSSSLEPMADSLGLSALVAAAAPGHRAGPARRRPYEGPLAGLLGARRRPRRLPRLRDAVGQTVSSAARGRLFGLFPIMWIVVNALWVYRMTVRTRHFDILRRSFGRLSDDPRIQALVIAFCFGALLEALAGFGAPVAICSVMLVALGFDPVRAAVVSLVANTAPVAFGAMATPVVTLAQVAGPAAGLRRLRRGPSDTAARPCSCRWCWSCCRRAARAARDLDARARVRGGLRRRPVRRLQLRLPAARRHRRRAGGAAALVGAAAGPAGPPPNRCAPPS